jgi:LysM repeat protein
VVIAHPALPAPQHAVVARANPAPHGWQLHLVRAGDTVSALAVSHRSTISAIVARNHLPANGRLIHPGQRIWVPRTTPVKAAKPSARTVRKPARPAAKPRPQPAYRIHAVASGQNLSVIAARYRTTVPRIAKLNGIDPGRWIHPGQRLRIPSGGSVNTATKVAKRTAAKKKAALRPERYRKGGLAVTKDQNRLAVRDLIATTARRHGVDPKLAMAIGWQESGWTQSQYSSAHARGVMQVIPDAGDWASSMIGRKLDLRRTEDNVTAGVVILRALTRMADNRDEAIASYYQGFGSVRSRGWYEDTKQYVANVNYFRTRL